MFEGSRRKSGEPWLVLSLLVFASGCTEAEIFRCTSGTPALVEGRYVCVGGDAGSDASADASMDASSDASATDAGWPTCSQTLTRTECDSNALACASGETCLQWYASHYCRKTCTIDSDCSSVHFASRCIEWEMGLRGCSTPCQPGDDSTCGAGETCSYVADPVRGGIVFTECRSLVVQGAPFATCPPANATLCAANSACWYSNDANNTAGTGDSRCLAQCRIGHPEDCSALPGTTCKGSPAAGLCGQSFGICQF